MKVIKEWRNATESMAKAFVRKYFPKQRYGEDTFWVADRIGGIFFVSDYSFDIDRMIEALELKATFDQLINYCEEELELGMKGKNMPINFSDFVKYGGVNKIIENNY